MARHVRSGRSVRRMHAERSDPILFLFSILVGAIVVAIGMAVYLVFLSSG